MIYHAETNGNLEGLREWNEYLLRFGNKVNLRQKTSLVKRGYIARNPNYDPKYFESHKTWTEKILGEHMRLAKELVKISPNGAFDPYM